MGDTITARVEVVEVDNEKKRVRMRTTCVNQNTETVLDGEAVVSPPRRWSHCREHAFNRMEEPC